MGTLVCFHAHPDDESIVTGGVMARAAAEGHRVVLVVATKGELGVIPEGLLAEGEALWQRRVIETQRSAEVLGVDRVEFLGYHDSGMDGDPANDAPGSFWTADVDEASDRLAALLRDVRADVLTIYDDHGSYGHPDHIQVHRVGKAAGEKAGTPFVYEATSDRDFLREGIEFFSDATSGLEFEAPELDLDTFGTPREQITTTVDVRPYVDAKRASMRAHASQISEQSFFLAMPDEIFEMVFGTEWFVRVGAPPGTHEEWLFP
jgi:LmbE family N-acetylglucosaminyl deacetylase